MPTLGQTALSRGFAAIARVHPSLWSFGGSTFTGTIARIGPDSPMMMEDPKARLQLKVRTSDLPTPRPEGSGFLRQGSAEHRILRAWHDATSGLSTYLLTESDGGDSS